MADVRMLRGEAEPAFFALCGGGAEGVSSNHSSDEYMLSGSFH